MDAKFVKHIFIHNFISDNIFYVEKTVIAMKKNASCFFRSLNSNTTTARTYHYLQSSTRSEFWIFFNVAIFLFIPKTSYSQNWWVNTSFGALQTTGGYGCTPCNNVIGNGHLSVNVTGSVCLQRAIRRAACRH